MRLSALRTGDKGLIVKVLGHGGFRKRIVEMGFVRGQLIEVLLNAPLNDPIKYRIMGYEISLRRQEAEMIEVVSETENSTFKELESSSEQSEEKFKELATRMDNVIRVALVGNPNCGKTSLFNIASGAHEHVGNYSGVTIDAKEGHFDFKNYRIKIVDLPGTYSLSAYSPEELYVRKHIVDQTPDVIINVVDASNLERNLFLTTQLIDMNVRMVIALNMYDELEKSGNTINHSLLGKLLGAPMVPTVCRKEQGIESLFDAVIQVYNGSDTFSTTHNTSQYHHIHINHGIEVERAIELIKTETLQFDCAKQRYSNRFLAIKLLERDTEIEDFIAQAPNKKKIIETRDAASQKIATLMDEDCEAVITNAKYGFIAGALKETFVENKIKPRHITNSLDAILTHKFWGFPLFFLFIYIMFEATFTLGEYPMSWIENGVNLLSDLLKSYMSEGILKDLLIDGIVAGVGGVIVFLPNILLLYLFISLMEDTGYMARAAFIMDKIMHKIGLHGKSFIPLIMGFGCNVPAILATRTIENRKNRLVTMLINPLMSCSARLPVYLLFVGTFFPGQESLVLFSIYMVGILLAVLMSKLFSRHLLKGEDTPFVMELPPYRIPTSKAIFRHTWEKGEQYLRKMGTIILVASIIIWFLGYYPTGAPNLTPAQKQEQSYIGQIGKAIEPAVKPLGFDWKLGVGLITGATAKEVVVSTLGILYAEDDQASETTIGSRIPITPLVAYSYMLFVLIYFPCVATIIAIKQESGSWKWGAFVVLYTTVLAWIVSFLVFQIGSLIIH